jgi:hypothetical protein
MPPDLRILTERYCPLALLLPQDDFDPDEDADRTTEILPRCPYATAATTAADGAVRSVISGGRSGRESN